MPEELFGRIRKTVKPQWKTCLISALLLGLAAHIYKLTNWLPNWDSLVFRQDEQNMLHLGRWFLSAVCGLSSDYELPWLNGILALLWIGCAAVCVCQIFHVEKKLTAGLIGGLMAVFPTVTSTMTYAYVADGYCLALLMSCIAAALLIKGGKARCAAGSLLITLSLGIYQAYLSMTIMLLLCHLIQGLLFEDETPAASLKKAGRFLLWGLIGCALYYGILQLLLTAAGTALSDYQGMGDTAVSVSLGTLIQCFDRLRAFFFSFSEGVSVYNLLNGAVAVLTVAGCLIAAVKNHCFRPWYRVVLLAVYAAALPIGASVLYLLNPSLDFHNLMTMGYSVFYLFFILLYEKEMFPAAKLAAAKNWSILVLTTAVILNMTVLANISYHKLQLAYEKSYGVLIRIADRIEQTEGTADCGEILVVGSLPGSEAYSVNFPPDMTGITDSYILRADDEVVGQSVLCSALNDYCGTDYRFLAGDRADALKQTDMVSGMPQWPAKGCVTVADGVIVIKLGEENE